MYLYVFKYNVHIHIYNVYIYVYIKSSIFQKGSKTVPMTNSFTFITELTDIINDCPGDELLLAQLKLTYVSLT